MFNSCEAIFVCGDYNINLLSPHIDAHTGSYFDGILRSGFLPTKHVYYLHVYRIEAPLLIIVLLTNKSTSTSRVF